MTIATRCIDTYDRIIKTWSCLFVLLRWQFIWITSREWHAACKLIAWRRDRMDRSRTRHHNNWPNQSWLNEQDWKKYCQHCKVSIHHSTRSHAILELSSRLNICFTYLMYCTFTKKCTPLHITIQLVVFIQFKFTIFLPFVLSLFKLRCLGAACTRIVPCILQTFWFTCPWNIVNAITTAHCNGWVPT